MSSTINFRTATVATTATLAPAPRREATTIKSAGPVRGTDFGKKGPQRPQGPERPQRRRIGVGIAALLAVTGIFALVQQAGTESSQPTAPADVVSAVDTSRGPNVDLPPDWTSTATRLAPAVNAGPNADLAPNWAAGQTTAAPSVNRGPNADLAPNWAND
ncbi:MAG: hypothetical protein HKN03_17970 [Acidimicrobiales bacterium]|nr:hypothetical protein [Acidimicrobiales bacterium]